MYEDEDKSLCQQRIFIKSSFSQYRTRTDQKGGLRSQSPFFISADIMSSSKRPPPGASSQHAGSGSPFEQQAKRHKTAAPEQDVGPKLQEKMLKDVQLKDLAAELQSRAKSTLMELETRIHAGDISCIEEFEAVHDLLQDTSGEIGIKSVWGGRHVHGMDMSYF